MNLVKKKKKKVNIANSGALSDLAFLLIIFFIVVAVFNINKGFLLLLPKKNSTKVVNVNDIIKVSLRQDKSIVVDNSEITLRELETLAKEASAIYPNMTFLLTIDPLVPYQQVVEIVELVRRLQVENFSFVMKGDGR